MCSHEKTHLLGGMEKCLSATEGAKDKKIAAAKFQGWLQKLVSDEIIVYSDKSHKTDLMGNTVGKQAHFGYFVGKDSG